MSTIVTRSGKGSALTHNEMDANFTNLNTDKLELADLGNSATKDVGTGSGDVAAGDHTHSGVYEPVLTAASQGEMEAGTEAALRSMSPLRIKQAIDALTPSTVVNPVWQIKTTTYTAASDEAIMADTSGGAWTLTLPASPSANDVVHIADYAGTFATYNLTVARNSLKIMGLSEDMTVSDNNAAFTLTYIDATEGWRLT